ncbi:N-acylneuraminate cytidylyltransferase [Synechococcus sp. BIOS-U3-1]|uniref:cytidylyltransferase domain-containing protein n=1 Tax=Synechococcus sp. BIOS-U3-1 TaxID=1400865 RepID=UPI001648E7E6|nr:hypothetical protein [Synechococcus sp. BIOS-U3-1]QNI57183.1 N-acylneuraminate cytidylyltransferase [Synechococcus sp. BIOS-U3-1]
MRLLITVLARGGSRRVPRKNIRLLSGVPVIFHTLNVIRDSNISSDIVVSTEDPEISQLIATSSFSSSLRLRPHYLSSDTTPSFAVIQHILDSEDSSGCNFTHVLNIPPTAALIRVDDLWNLCSFATKFPTSSIISVKPFNVPFESSYIMSDELDLLPNRPDLFTSNTQSFARSYYDCGLYSLIPVKYIRSWPSYEFYKVSLKGLSINHPCVDVDDESDWDDLVSLFQAFSS